jgi:GT2 family glycosyltransferase
MPPASIVIPTKGRLSYLRVALASIVPAAREQGAEIVVVDDGGASPEMRAAAEQAGALYEPHDRPRGLNVARNTGVDRSRGELVVFVDDDVSVSEAWLAALLEAAAENPDVDVFTGPIRAQLEGPAPRTCGSEDAPITTLDLGPADTDTEFAWGANMAVRRGALLRVGPFDPSLEDGGDEQEWQERLRRREPGARVRYVAKAGVLHRRVGRDARLRALCRGAYVRGRAARRFDARRGRAPSLRAELRTLAGCLGHVLRRRCPAGLTMAAHSSGRLREGVRERALGVQQPRLGEDADFLSGASGTVGGLDRTRRRVADRLVDACEIATARRARLSRAARLAPPVRSVLAVGVERPERRGFVAQIRAELARSRHRVELHTCEPQGRGKFESLDALLAEHPPGHSDWLLVIDDDVELPHGFLDRFIFLCERFSLALAQPAHRLDSHAAWLVTRRHACSAVRETSFVEIGPVTAFARRTFPVLLPFPQLRMGWGLDLHWAALAREHGWRCGVLDAVAIRHRAAPAAAAYDREAAVAEARELLADRPYVSAREAERTLATHRRW